MRYRQHNPSPSPTAEPGPVDLAEHLPPHVAGYGPDGHLVLRRSYR